MQPSQLGFLRCMSPDATRRVPLAGLAYAEAWLHQHFKDRRVKGEWFAIAAAEVPAAFAKAVIRARAYERHSEMFANA